MLKTVLIFRTHGVMVYSHSYTVGGKEPAIVSGFLAAFSSFAKEIGEGQIRSITMHNSLVLMAIQRDLCFAVFFDQDDDETQGKFILEKMIESFFLRYQDLLKQKHVDLNEYQGFTKTLDKLVVMKNVYEIVESTSNLLTIKEIQTTYAEKFGENVAQAKLKDVAEVLVENDAIRKITQGKDICYRKKGELLKGFSAKFKKNL